MWKDSEQAKKRQKTEGQLGGKITARAPTAVAIGEETIKEEEGEIWDKKALDALFNKTVQYSVINSYISAITKLYAWQLKGKALLPL